MHSNNYLLRHTARPEGITGALNHINLKLLQSNVGHSLSILYHQILEVDEGERNGNLTCGILICSSSVIHPFHHRLI